jgi:S-(hydroxymethyl)glutathione dehydrogenase/alcohol dehydrogenase
MMKAQALVADAKGGFRLEEIEVFEPQKGEVLVELKAAGVCHTDYKSLSWQMNLVLGHEGAGIVKAVGPEVKAVKPGDAVVLNWAIPCGKCFQCLEGNQSICEDQPKVPGERTTCKGEPIARSFGLGSMSTLTVVPEAAAVKIHVKIPFASACIIGCGVMTGYGSAVNAAKVKPGSSVAVIGAGGVGLNVIQGARISGAKKIIAVDIQSSRLEMAKEYGATHAVLAEKSDKNLLAAAAKVKELCDGRGADYAFECTAVPALGAAPLAMVRNAGTACQVSGIEENLNIDMNLFEWDKIYLNPLYGKCRPQIDIPAILDLYAKGDMILDKMVTKTYPLRDLGKALEDMHAGKNAKGVLLIP